MVWTAQSWSDLCPNFLHGFPRRLVSHKHGGFLTGNIYMAAKVTNQVVRNVALGDVSSVMEIILRNARFTVQFALFRGIKNS